VNLNHRKNTAERKSWGCPRTKNRSSWCHSRCVPREGVGDCGRLAPHAMLGRTQLAILAVQAKQSEDPWVDREG
jgi:hypothetical protein